MRPLSHLALLLVPLAMTCISPGLARAAWPHDPTNGNVPVCTASGGQANPTIVSDGAGGAIITWSDVRNNNADIYAQRLNAAGVPQWTANGVALCTAVSDQVGPMIVSDGAGGAIVTWQDYRSGNYDIYTQRVNAAGVVQWTPNGVVLCAAANTQQYPTIVLDGAGGAIVTWQDSRSGSTWDIYAQRVNAGGAVQWTANGVALCTAVGDQDYPTIVSDGAGGAIVTWHDYRNNNADIYAQRVNALGAVQWTADGVALCTAANGQLSPTIASDGAGGAIVTWLDGRSGTNFDIYAQRVNAAGVPQWAANGVTLCTAVSDQVGPMIVPDGAGGAIVAWQDYRSGNYDIYTQRVSAAGVAQWTANGAALCTAANNQQYPTIVSDGAGGAIVAWQDHRGSYNSIYAQRVDQWGYLGAQPAIASVKDVPNDQGGKVKVSWYASPLDSFPSYSIASYLIYRSVPPNLAAQALRAGATLVTGAEGGEHPNRRAIVARTEGTLTTFWEYVGTVAADGIPGYSYLSPTACDSVGGSNPSTLFMVEARTVSGGQHWFSDPDSGYSVDNLPPVTPALLTGNYAAGVTHLHWRVNSEADLAGYRLYRGSSAGFVPGPSNLVAAQADTGYRDVGSAGSYYKLSAVDTHGNESGLALLTPASTTDVGGGAAPRELAFAAPSPNPARQEALLSFALPQAGPVKLAVYDLSGRRVRTVRAGWLEAGEYKLPFDLRDGAERRLPSGVYLVRLETDARTLVRRLAIVE
jgi:hypothetical protein